jgi:exopolyphosphatase/guanosine-5'-triphosphate,3'-diphosphate pyrophosphatase
VEKTALDLFERASVNWSFDPETHGSLLSWAALLHEIGLDIAHNDYHKHGAYITLHSDMPGFSLQQQQFLATLIRAHRRKIYPELFTQIPKRYRAHVMRLAILLRLAVILQRTRLHVPCEIRNMVIDENSLTLEFNQEWCDSHVLILADLQRESELLTTLQFKIAYNCL